MSNSELEELLYLHIKCIHNKNGLPLPQCEYMFRKHTEGLSRNWKSDFVWPEYNLVFEVEGGVWSQGRHTRGQGFTNDVEKYNWLTLHGWKVLRGTAEHVKKGQAILWICEALGYKY